MTAKLSMTIDVEDFYEGMSVLGEDLERPSRAVDRLEDLVGHLAEQPSNPKVTLFVVGWHAANVSASLKAFSSDGHEIASHGPDHGRLPTDDLVGWLKKGRLMLEDLIQAPVKGFRSPRFDLPPHGDLKRYREELFEAGYEYVSDASNLGTGSPVREAPVMSWKGVRMGGGSYQRAIPFALVSRAIKDFPGTAVCYYHSYDFDGTTKGLNTFKSQAVAKQLVARGRIQPIFLRLAHRFGSETCLSAAV